MKIGIITITELSNFGNRLQNYALQTTLEKMGHEAETIPNYIIYRHFKQPMDKAKRLVVKGLGKRILRGDNLEIAELLKQRSFDSFDKKYIKKASDAYSDIHFITPDLGKQYDCFVAGSDQIWNPYFCFNFDFEFLRFADVGKRIAYSASFGVSHIPDEKVSYFGYALSEIPTISVREYTGRSIVKQLTGRDVPVTADPTLLLTKEEWSRIAKRPKWCDERENYILVYFLGDPGRKNECLNSLIGEREAFHRCKVIDIHDPENLKHFGIGPCEFIWLIQHAKCMITDSFHGTVFSILMEKPFISVQRQGSEISMNSRIESLFFMLNIKQRDDMVYEHILEPEKVDDALHHQRVVARDYLRKAISQVRT